VTSLHILGEFRRVLTQPRFSMPAALTERVVSEMVAFMDVVPVQSTEATWASDPKDNPIVETALQGDAAVIVTGDRRLLQAEVPGIRLLTVAEMLGRISGHE